jgi:hypothetical protein
VISTETTGLNPHKRYLVYRRFAVVDDSIFISDSFDNINTINTHDNKLSNLLLKAR